MNHKMEMKYDEEADYLEIFIGEPREDYGEHISKDIVIFKYENNDQLYGIGIYNFKKRASDLKDVLNKLPISIKIESI